MNLNNFNIINLIKCKYQYYKPPSSPTDHNNNNNDCRCRCITNNNNNYFIVPASPATGILYITENSPGFISGHVRLRGKNGGRYPYNYLEMIDNVFGKEENTIEVCSDSVRGRGEQLQYLEKKKNHYLHHYIIFYSRHQS